MAISNIIDEYLVAIKPAVDSSEFDGVLGKISDKFKSKKEQWSEYTKLKFDFEEADKKVLELQKKGPEAKEELEEAVKSRDDLKSKFEKLSSSMGKSDKLIAELSSGISQGIGYITTLIALFKLAIDVGEKIVDKGVQYSNQFVSGESIFADSEIKSIMSNLGVDTKTAQGMNFALEGLGITMDDLSTATSAQRKQFASLTNQYSELMNQINPDKLQRYNEVMQKYQLRELEMRMKLQVAMIEFFAESEALPKLVDNLGDMFEGIVNLLSSDTAQFAFETFISFIEMLVGIISTPVNWLGGLVNGSNTTNNNDIKVTQNNMYNGNFKNNSNTDLALQIKQALNG